MLFENELRRYVKWFVDKGDITKSDYKYKGTVISNKIQYEVAKIKKNIYFNNLFDDLGIYNANLYENESLSIMYDSLVDKFGFRSILESLRINNARYHRITRLRNRVESIINTNINSYFLTLTFTNHYLTSTDALTRRRYITRYLKSITSNYIANIDFGKRKGREHYHAIVQCDFIDSKLWKYGNLDFKLIDISKESCVDCLSKYVSKLSNHAIKYTNKRTCLIYPKNK